MSTRGHIPVRTCVGCGQRAEQPALVRVAVTPRGVAVDTRRRLPGRGAWIHSDMTNNKTCVERALKRGIRRSLRLGSTGISVQDAESLRRDLTPEQASER